MSYSKAMKWGAKHRKGTKQMYMGFNPSGITSQQIKDREQAFVMEMKRKTKEERSIIWSNIKEMTEQRCGSWEWEWCAFQRNFVFQGNVI